MPFVTSFLSDEYAFQFQKTPINCDIWTLQRAVLICPTLIVDTTGADSLVSTAVVNFLEKHSGFDLVGLSHQLTI